MTVRMPESSEESKTTAEIAANSGESRRIREILAKIQYNDGHSMGCIYQPDTNWLPAVSETLNLNTTNAT